MTTAIRTADQLLHAQDLGPCELIRGKLRTLAYNDLGHGQAVGRLGAAIGKHVEALRLGALLINTGFVLSRDPDTVRAPDIALLGPGHDDLGSAYLEGAPDLAIEVVSHDDQPGYIRQKVADWLKAGAKSVWVVDPGDRTVTVHEPRRRTRLLRERDTLSGGGLLPGFEVRVATIFA